MQHGQENGGSDSCDIYQTKQVADTLRDELPAASKKKEKGGKASASRQILSQASDQGEVESCHNRLWKRKKSSGPEELPESSRRIPDTAGTGKVGKKVSNKQDISKETKGNDCALLRAEGEVIPH